MASCICLLCTLSSSKHSCRHLCILNILLCRQCDALQMTVALAPVCMGMHGYILFLDAQVENVECLPGDHIKFDFLGKDSIRYENEVVVHPKVYALIQKFCQQSSTSKKRESVQS